MASVTDAAGAIEPPLDAGHLALRDAVYRCFATSGRAPTAPELAATLGWSLAAVRAGLEALARHRQVVLASSDGSIRLANPFSSAPTGFQVSVGGVEYWASCAFDAFGVAAALAARDATIAASCAASGVPIRLAIVAGSAGGDEILHFGLPFRDWFDDRLKT